MELALSVSQASWRSLNGTVSVVFRTRLVLDASNSPSYKTALISPPRELGIVERFQSYKPHFAFTLFV